MLLIPAMRDTPAYGRRVTLDGREYVLSLRWNMRSGWYLGLTDQDEVTIFSPRKLVVRLNLLLCARYDSRTPPGALFAYDLDGAGRPEYDDLISRSAPYDGRVALVYVPESEL